MHAPSRTLSALDYSTLHQASAPDLSRPLGGSGGSFHSTPAGSCVGDMLRAAQPAGMHAAALLCRQQFGVQRSAASASALGGSGGGGMGALVGARAAARAVRRSPSMHERMLGLVLSAKERSSLAGSSGCTSPKGRRASVAAAAAAAAGRPATAAGPALVTLRTAGQVVGDLGLTGRPTPAVATVRARSGRVRALLVRRRDAEVLRGQPALKVRARTLTRSSLVVGCAPPCLGTPCLGRGASSPAPVCMDCSDTP
jgi:hypothetical protein